jgi:hypothetical protein
MHVTGWVWYMRAGLAVQRLAEQHLNSISKLPDLDSVAPTLPRQRLGSPWHRTQMPQIPVWEGTHQGNERRERKDSDCPFNPRLRHDASFSRLGLLDSDSMDPEN